MITCYFGVPGSGKTTLLTKFAIKELNRINKGKSKYKKVYTNFYCNGCYKIDFNDFEKLKVEDSLILLDEITLDADNRNFKSFSTNIRDFFILHRHLGNDIIYATQSYELVDKKIRQLTQELWYMSKTVVPLFSNWTLARRIYRKINISEYTSELTLGYRFCNLIEALFVSNCRFVYRPLYYPYFDSFDEGCLGSRRVVKDILYDDFVPLSNIYVLSKYYVGRVSTACLRVWSNLYLIPKSIKYNSLGIYNSFKDFARPILVKIGRNKESAADHGNDESSEEISGSAYDSVIKSIDKIQDYH